MEPQDVQKMIDTSIAKATAFATKKYGDTPTDALQLVPKKYVTSVLGTVGAAGPTGAVQFNNGGSLGGSSVLAWDNSSSILSLNSDFSSSKVKIGNAFGDNTEWGMLVTSGNQDENTQYASTGVFITSSSSVVSAFESSAYVIKRDPFTTGSVIGISATTIIGFNDNSAVSVVTTNATPTTFATFSPSTTDFVFYVRITITARRLGGSSGTPGDSATYVRRLALKSVSNTLTQIGSFQDVFTAEDQAGWDVTLTTSGSNYVIQVTGAANNTILWQSLFEEVNLTTA